VPVRLTEPNYRHIAPQSRNSFNVLRRPTERIEILKGLLDFRDGLKTIGIIDGFQWLAGSFVENIELNRGRSPADIDLVTFAHRPFHDLAAWTNLVQSNTQLFDPHESKQQFRCDAYFIDLSKKGDLIALDVAYFNGLFSHQRVTSLWKGMIVVPLASDDANARQLL
jgi:hypothetical protein